MAAFFTVFTTGGIKEKGAPKLDLEIAQINKMDYNNINKITVNDYDV